MKTPVIISILFLAAASCLPAAEPTELTEARNQYLQTLLRMKDAFTSAGKGDDARAVQSEINALSPPSGLAKRLADTTWAYSTKPNDPHPTMTVTIHADQTVSWSDRPSLHVAFQPLDERTLQVKDRVWKFSANLQSFTIHNDMNAPANRWGTKIKSPK